MTNRELLDRIRAVVTELDTLTQAADQNSKYHTQRILRRASLEARRAESALVWRGEKD